MKPAGGELVSTIWASREFEGGGVGGGEGLGVLTTVILNFALDDGMSGVVLGVVVVLFWPPPPPPLGAPPASVAGVHSEDRILKAYAFELWSQKVSLGFVFVCVFVFILISSANAESVTRQS